MAKWHFATKTPLPEKPGAAHCPLKNSSAVFCNTYCPKASSRCVTLDSSARENASSWHLYTNNWVIYYLSSVVMIGTNRSMTKLWNHHPKIRFNAPLVVKPWNCFKSFAPADAPRPKACYLWSRSTHFWAQGKPSLCHWSVLLRMFYNLSFRLFSGFWEHDNHPANRN